MPRGFRTDKAPNYFTVNLVQSAGDANTTLAVDLPNATIPTGRSVTIIELIKINFAQITTVGDQLFFNRHVTQPIDSLL